MASRKYLLDVNVLVALLEKDHVHHRMVRGWFDSDSHDWGICAFTEAGFLRFATNPRFGAHSVRAATDVLASLADAPGYRYWHMAHDWNTLMAPFSQRIFGHQQVTDAFLLGLVVNEGAVLVTLDKAILHLAGKEHSRNVLLLE